MAQTRKTVDRKIKVIVIGDSSSGKSSIVERYVDGTYNANYVTTICLDFKLKYVERRDKRMRIDIYDTAGQERFRSVAKAYYKNVDICILVCDITEYKSFENVNYWMTEFKRYGTNDDAVCMLVGNKTDLPRVVETRQLAELAYKYGCKFIETSAKNGSEIDKLFDTLIDDVMRIEKVAQMELPKIELEKKETIVKNGKDVCSC